mmetsp:Transcript_504/g.762  ORF Transcript_504/g.762 Transcript_504/m.762 type:complete len:248 (+) Transcript_504:66-809(+)
MHPHGSLLCIISKNNIRPSPLETSKSLKYNSLLIQPSPLTRSLNHTIFSRNMICRNGKIGIILQTTNDIQIRHTRLDHEHIGSLRSIQCRFHQSLPSIRRILLIRLLIPKSRMGIKRITEWSIVRTCIFRRISENGNIRKPLGIQSIPNGTNASIHHIRRSNNICPRPRLRNSLFAQLINSNIVQNLAIFHGTIMPLIRIRIQCHIGTNNRIGVFLFNHSDGTMNDSIGVICFHAEVGLEFIRYFRE